MKIVLFGSTGMLGSYVYKILSKSYDIITFTRSDFNILYDTWEKLTELLKKIQEKYVIVNCAGIIPQKTSITDYKSYIRVNTVFPHKLQEICKMNKCKLIHITTDCVFNGSKGNYIEGDKHTETGIYGISKSLGEPKDSTIIRTSIIGEEHFSKKSLLEWIISNKNKKINGYINHYWNGITCLELSKIIDKIIKNNLFWKGNRHIHSPDIVSKYDLTVLINKIYKLNINIDKFKTPKTINKTLKTTYNINFDIKKLKNQIEELYAFSH